MGWDEVERDGEFGKNESRGTIKIQDVIRVTPFTGWRPLADWVGVTRSADLLGRWDDALICIFENNLMMKEKGSLLLVPSNNRVAREFGAAHNCAVTQSG